MKHGQRKADVWFPFFIDKWLFGSTRYELEPDEQSAWIDLLVLSKKDDGYIRANETTPYPLKQLAAFFNKPEELVLRTIQKLLDPKIGKLKEPSPGIYYLPSQETYELSERQKRRIRAELGDAMAAETAIMAGKADTGRTSADAKIRLEKNRIDENREEEDAAPSSLTEHQEIQIRKAALEVLPPAFVETRALPTIRALQAEFKLRDPVEAFKKKTAWWRDKPATLRGNLSLQLRNWWRLEAEWEAEKRTPLEVGKNKQPEKPADQEYKAARKIKIEALIEAKKKDIQRAKEKGDTAALDKIENDIKTEMADWSRLWHKRDKEEEEK